MVTGTSGTGNALNVDTGLVWDAVNNKLGIGGAPSYPLDVTGVINTSGGVRFSSGFTQYNVGLTYIGNWTSSTTYRYANMVFYTDGVNISGLFLCKVSSVSSANGPLADTTSWTPIITFAASTVSGGGSGGEIGTCFPAGAQVLMADLTTRSIETVAPGDLLWTPVGAQLCLELDTPLLGQRRMLGFEDGSLLWSEEHALWARKNGREWFWSANPKMWQEEVQSGMIGGLRDNSTIMEGMGYQYAHITGWKSQTVVELDNFRSDTQLYLPRTSGWPIVVDGYLVGAGVNEFEVNYHNIAWQEHVNQLKEKDQT